MDVITKLPIVSTTSAQQTKSEIRRTYDAADGILDTNPMVVTTDYPIVYTNSPEASEAEYRATYSAFLDGLFGSRSERAARKQIRKGKRKKFIQKVGTGIKKFAQSDIGKAVVGAALGGGATAPTETGGYGTTLDTTPTETKKGLSTGAKIGIAVAGIAVVGIIIYAITKKSKK